eukprot:216547-Rhodomonas_salina.2
MQPELGELKKLTELHMEENPLRGPLQDLLPRGATGWVVLLKRRVCGTEVGYGATRLGDVLAYCRMLLEIRGTSAVPGTQLAYGDGACGTELAYDHELHGSERAYGHESRMVTNMATNRVWPRIAYGDE